jgi:hypothetical protein
LIKKCSKSSEVANDVLDATLLRVMLLLMELPSVGRNRYISLIEHPTMWSYQDLCSLIDMLQKHDQRSSGSRQKLLIVLEAWKNTVSSSSKLSDRDVDMIRKEKDRGSENREVGNMLDELVVQGMILQRSTAESSSVPATSSTSTSTGEIIRQMVEQTLRSGSNTFRDVVVSVFGSASTGLASVQSDVDLMVARESDSTSSMITTVEDVDPDTAALISTCVQGVVDDMRLIIRRCGENARDIISAAKILEEKKEQLLTAEQQDEERPKKKQTKPKKKKKKKTEIALAATTDVVSFIDRGECWLLPLLAARPEHSGLKKPKKVERGETLSEQQEKQFLRKILGLLRKYGIAIIYLNDFCSMFQLLINS